MILPRQHILAAIAILSMGLGGSAISSEHVSQPSIFEDRWLQPKPGAVRLARLPSPQTTVSTPTAGEEQAKETPHTRLASLPSVSGMPLIGRKDEPATPTCLMSPTPPAVLETQSKYDQSDRSRSNVDTFAEAERKRLIQPIRNSVRLVTKIAYAPSDNDRLRRARAECVLQNLDHWAESQALTDMKTSDALLTRDRWVAEVVLALNAVNKVVELSDDRRDLYTAWLNEIAASTIEAYTHRLGPKSRTNNHRYWAGLAVAAIGVFIGDDELNNWGAQSFAIGACQVDRQGLLPLELARGSLALDYHVYALRPLAAIVRLKDKGALTTDLDCLEGFQRLQRSVQGAKQDESLFERVSGVRQMVKNDERSFSKALQRQQLGI